MYPTRNDLPEETRKQLIDLLNRRLADCADLKSQAKQAHWNVKGPRFYQLHLLFDEVAASAEEFTDLIAERAVQLGGVAKGTVRMAADCSELPEYPLEARDGLAHATAVANALSEFGKRARKAIDQCGELGDQDSADMFTEISRAIDKHLWFVEAHLQAPE